MTVSWYFPGASFAAATLRTPSAALLDDLVERPVRARGQEREAEVLAMAEPLDAARPDRGEERRHRRSCAYIP